MDACKQKTPFPGGEASGNGVKRTELNTTTSSQKSKVNLDVDNIVNTIKCALTVTTEDPGAPYEPGVIEALKSLYESRPADYIRYRAEFKAVNRTVSVTRLDELVKGVGKSENESKADELVLFLKKQAEFFCNAAQECFATFEQDGHRETWPILSKGFENWAGFVYYKSQGRTAGDAATKTAIGALSGVAKYEGVEREVFLRTAPYEDGYMIDLCNGNWSALHVTSKGWAVLKNPPVYFWRTNTMQSLPEPSENGNLDLLWNHLNIRKEDRPFILAWILEAFRPETPFVIAEFAGGQGTGKSSTQNNIRDLVDPNSVNLRAAPKNCEDVFVGAGSNWAVSYNNLSHLSAQMQDALCTLSTGGGFASRTLYTNFDESVIEVKRPVLFNGISTLATAQDLIDRVVHFGLDEITVYRTESELREEFNEQKSIIFAGILDLFVQVLKKLPKVEIERPPRMADFARLGEAMLQAMGEKPGVFVSAYEKKRKQAAVNALDSSPVALAVQKYVKCHPEGFVETLMKDAFDQLSVYRPDGEAWPKSPRGLGDALRRNAPGLKAVGIKIVFHPRDSQGLKISARCILLPEKKSFADRYTQRTQHTQKPADNVLHVCNVRQNEKQNFAGEKSIDDWERTPDAGRERGSI